MKARIFIGSVLVAAVTYAVISAVRERPFAPAADLPRGALVYLQFENLPAFIKMWNQSAFKQKYLQSQNFDDLSKRHLGMKIASRWQEFSDAAGFPIDLDVMSTLADKRAAFAVYDIGKMDFVFIAPMRAELFEATTLMQNVDKFDDEQVEDGTHIYSVDVDADRGRQKQKIMFTHVKNRLIVSTSEKLLAQTVSIVTGRIKKSALADDPAFSTLRDRTTPHTLAVWVDQTALNADYYFKHYWLMNGVDDLKNLRSGLFDLDITEQEIVEKREFLLNQPVAEDAISPADADKLLAHVTDSERFYRLQTATTSTLQNALVSITSTGGLQNGHADTYDSDQNMADTADFDYDDDYNDRFDQYIDDAGENNAQRPPGDITTVDFSAALQPAKPRTMLTLARPDVQEAPLSVEFSRTAIVTLGAPASFERSAFEAAVVQALEQKLLVRGEHLDCHWITKAENAFSRRELDLPALGWGIQYLVKGDLLFVSNSPAMLSELVAAQPNNSHGRFSPAMQYTVFLPAASRQDFSDTFSVLTAGKGDFFMGNILSIIDAAPAIDRIELRKNYAGKIMSEELKATFRSGKD